MGGVAAVFFTVLVMIVSVAMDKDFYARAISKDPMTLIKFLEPHYS